MSDIPSIADSLARIKTAKTAIIEAIIAKGGTVEGTPAIQDLAACIRTIPVEPEPIPDPNPLNLPAYTIRVKFDSEPDLISEFKGSYVEVSGQEYTYDFTYENSNWTDLFRCKDIPWAFIDEGCCEVIEILGANTEGVTNMSYMFGGWNTVTSVAYFDTSSVTDMSYMFNGCNITSVPKYDTSNVTTMQDMFDSCANLIEVPVFDTSKVTNMMNMFCECSRLKTVPLLDTSMVTDMTSTFKNCRAVESGALALYQQASSQTTPPDEYVECFCECGLDTQTGAAELAQIPSDWK